MTETRILKTLALIGTAGFIWSTWISDTPAHAVRNTVFALIALLVIAWLGTGYQVTITELDQRRDREREVTDQLLADSKARIDGLTSRTSHSSGANS